MKDFLVGLLLIIIFIFVFNSVFSWIYFVPKDINRIANELKEIKDQLKNNK